jgi:phosphatidate phosphatase PAH1
MNNKRTFQENQDERFNIWLEMRHVGKTLDDLNEGSYYLNRLKELELKARYIYLSDRMIELLDEKKMLEKEAKEEYFKSF